jgi:hypothetical protein
MLVRAMVVFIPVSAVLVVSALVAERERSAGALLQLLGSAFLTIVVLTHVCEALGLLAWMNWGRKDSVGHYVDLAGAILGLILLTGGYVLRRMRKDHATA